MLIEGLPPDSAFGRQGKQWTNTDELTAVLVDRGEFWGSLLAQLAGRTWKDGAKPPESIQITHRDRPVPEPEKNKPVSLDEIARRFGGR